MVHIHNRHCIEFGPDTVDRSEIECSNKNLCQWWKRKSGVDDEDCNSKEGNGAATEKRHDRKRYREDCGKVIIMHKCKREACKLVAR